MKASYKIPYTLDTTFWDTEVPLKSEKTGFGFDKTLTIRELFLWIIALGIMWTIITKPFYMDGSLIGTLLFVIGYICFVYLLLRETDIPGVSGFKLIGPMVDNIADHRKRRLTTAAHGDYFRGSVFTGFAEPSQPEGYLPCVNEKGAITHYAVVYNIVGNASKNRFDADLAATIDGYVETLRGLDTNVTYSFITNTGGQRVDVQISALFDKLEHETNPEIIDLLQSEIRKLDSHVRGRFIALHQYVLLRAETKSDLRTGISNFQSMLANVGRVISHIERPVAEEEERILHEIYGGLTVEEQDIRIKTLPK